MEENCLQEFQIKEALLPILQSLIKEYSNIEPKSNNVMTRQNILKMITDICGVIYGKSTVTFSDVLNSISHSWNNISSNNKDDICESIGGVRDKNTVKKESNKLNLLSENINLEAMAKKCFNYYKSNSTEDGYMKYDKEYVNLQALKNKNEFIKILVENDIPYIDNLFNSKELVGLQNHIGEYFKRIFSLPQYKNLKFRDSRFEQ
jgi:hypothetical protein